VGMEVRGKKVFDPTRGLLCTWSAMATLFRMTTTSHSPYGHLITPVVWWMHAEYWKVESRCVVNAASYYQREIPCPGFGGLYWFRLQCPSLGCLPTLRRGARRSIPNRNSFSLSARRTSFCNDENSMTSQVTV